MSETSGAAGPSREDCLRATATALGLNPEAAVAHLDQALAHNREARLRADVVRRGAGQGTPRVEGSCPACGVRSLFVGAGGYVTCANLNCADPCSPSKALGVDFPPAPEPTTETSDERTA